MVRSFSQIANFAMVPDMLPPANVDFSQRLAQLRLGETSAIEKFVAEYEPYIRRSIRFRINKAALWPVTDSTDVSQSVLGGFLLRLSSGEFELSTEDDLRRLLLTIAKRKFLMLQRREFSAKRSRKVTRSLSEMPEVESISPPETFADFELAELIAIARSRLTKNEFQLLQMRQEGRPWEQIAQENCVEVVTLRKRLSRAIRRVAMEMGLEY